MLIDGAGGNARRFQIRPRHVVLALVAWALAMLLFGLFGFAIG